jgi:hypothetical protein
MHGEYVKLVEQSLEEIGRYADRPESEKETDRDHTPMSKPMSDLDKAIAFGRKHGLIPSEVEASYEKHNGNMPIVYNSLKKKAREKEEAYKQREAKRDTMNKVADGLKIELGGWDANNHHERSELSTYVNYALGVLDKDGPEAAKELLKKYMTDRPDFWMMQL